ncbi:hypothetical protein SHIRM173S_05837 [Streptomyces hirsutus]
MLTGAGESVRLLPEGTGTVAPRSGVAPSRRRTPRTRVGAVNIAPWTKRMAGPKPEAVARPARNRPGWDDSKPRPVAGEPSGRTASAPRSSAESMPSRSRCARNPVAAMTCSVSKAPVVPSRFTVSSRTPPGTAQAAVTSWPGITSTPRSTRSRTHHAPAGPRAAPAIRVRVCCGSRRKRPGRSE